MIHRIALLAASAAAALVLAIGLAVTGFGPADPTAGGQAVDQADPATATADLPAPTEQVQVDTVYVAPQPTPETIVTKVVKVKPARNGGEDGENEAEND
jgi:hypothetical protein